MQLLKYLSRRWKFFLGWLFYLSYAPQAFFYSHYRDWLERQLQGSPAEEASPTRPGKLLQAEATAKGGHFYFEQAELEVIFLAPDLVQLQWKPGISPIPYAISRHDWPVVETVLAAVEDGWSISSQGGEEGQRVLEVLVGVEGRVKFCNADGHTLREEMPPQRQGEAWSHQVQLQPEEHIYGLGERAAPLNLRQPKEDDQQGSSYRMWNFDAAGMYGSGADPLYICIPLYLSLHQQGSHLVFYENSYPATFAFADTATISFEGGALRYYVISGSPTEVLERYTELTGRAPLPPRWALGYHQSRWGYRTEQAVRETVQKFQAHNLPLSAIHLDIDVQVGFRAFTIDPDRFPKLASFTQELALQGVQFITILNPGVKYSRKSKLFLEGRILGVFCQLPNGEPVVAPVWPGWSVFPDFTNPLARHWWSRQYEYLLDVGVAGFWHDMNEPAAFIIWGDRSLPPRATKHWMEGRGGDHREAHNIYGLLQAKAGYESLCKYRSHQRPFIVSRAGWAGLQRYAWTWTGDVECTWSALRQTMATVIGLGLSGVPYSGPDIGGFQGNPTAELYLRWFQMSSFLTFCRTHSSNNVDHRTPWSYGEPTLSIIRQFLQLRYQLLPYFYTLAWEATQKGYPPVRPLFWLDWQDPDLWNVDDAFCLGDALLVCPVTEEGARSRDMVLPKGHWYSFWDDTLLEGPGQVHLEAPLEQIPLLVRAGSVLPMEAEQQLVLHLYAPIQGTYETSLYSDAGDGYGEWRLDQFRLTRTENSLELTWEQQGEYGFSYQGVQLQVHGLELQQVWVDGQAATFDGNCVRCDRFQQIRFQSQ